MGARHRLNLALLVLAAALGAGVWFAQTPEEKGPPLTALAPDAVTRVAIEHPGEPAIVLEKRDGHWRMTAPVQAEVDAFEINGPVGLADKEAQDTVEGASLAELGLDPPAYTVTLNEIAIAFGGVEPLQYRRYVRVGDVVSLIEDPPGAALDKDYADLIAKTLVPEGAELVRIELPKLTLAQVDGKWSVTPADPKASADAMQKLADGWQSARSMWNELAREAKVEGERVRLTLKDGSTREFIVASTDPQFKLHRADLGVSFVMSKALADELLQLAAPATEAPAAKSARPSGEDANGP